MAPDACIRCNGTGIWCYTCDKPGNDCNCEFDADREDCVVCRGYGKAVD